MGYHGAITPTEDTMELLNTLRWDEILSCALADPGCRLLAAMFLLMLLTACACEWLLAPSAPDA